MSAIGGSGLVLWMGRSRSIVLVAARGGGPLGEVDGDRRGRLAPARFWLLLLLLTLVRPRRGSFARGLFLLSPARSSPDAGCFMEQVLILALPPGCCSRPASLGCCK